MKKQKADRRSPSGEIELKRVKGQRDRREKTVSINL